MFKRLMAMFSKPKVAPSDHKAKAIKAKAVNVSNVQYDGAVSPHRSRHSGYIRKQVGNYFSYSRV